MHLAHLCPSACQHTYTDAQEYLLKFRERSYRHCRWVAGADLRARAKLLPGLVRKVANFDKLQAAARDEAEVRCTCRDCTWLLQEWFQAYCVTGHAQDDAEEPQELQEGIQPAWLKVDRVIAERVGAGGCAEVLVKVMMG